MQLHNEETQPVCVMPSCEKTLLEFFGVFSAVLSDSSHIVIGNPLKKQK